MTAKEELLRHIKDNKVEYVEIYRTNYDETRSSNVGSIIQGTLDEVLPLLDFEYEEVHEVCGTIWYVDGSWSERDDYNDMPYWLRHVRPTMPSRDKKTISPN